MSEEYTEYNISARELFNFVHRMILSGKISEDAGTEIISELISTLEDRRIIAEILAELVEDFRE